ncbi:MAG: hypothetical protein ACTSQ4_07325 [Candidatus Heimdallarchaeaceae archaeon]
MRKIKQKIFLILFISFFTLAIFSTFVTAENEEIASLTILVSSDTNRDIALNIKENLQNISITVILDYEASFVDFITRLIDRDFDLAIVGMSGGDDPDVSAIYAENGSLNIFGINTSIPYCNESENMLTDGIEILDLAERQFHYFTWQQLCMDKIVPILPLFNYNSENGTLTSQFNFLAFNLQNEFLGRSSNFEYLTAPGKEEYTQGVAVRKAICYGIDREFINVDVHDYNLTISHSPINPYLDYWYYDEIIKYDYNITLSEIWLTSAGYGFVQITDTNYYILGALVVPIFLAISRFNRYQKKKHRE